ncbi:hypothetical protein DNC80_12985 [Flavobacterium sp. SOK18b]|uniref:hypothetical protein n=1 Tax=Flavobacterium sp. SOK18b TaxID=797900 RepID=UPI0015FA984D|nr:hypothetical protein [Flavobacterium sp. SOK18b]MBB1194579.1 hypothetical protein [Flavobacterium sp. SOK18b]
MKTKTSLIIAVLLLIATSCNVIDDLLTFNIDNETSIQIDSAFPVGTAFTIITPDVTTNSSATFENNNTKADLVKDVKITDLKLTITNPSNKSFSFLKSIRLFISTDANDEIELAFLEDINSTATTLNLTCTSAKLDKYVKAPSYTIRTRAVVKETLTQDITVKANMKFRVTADPF